MIKVPCCPVSPLSCRELHFRCKKIFSTSSHQKQKCKLDDDDNNDEDYIDDNNNFDHSFWSQTFIIIIAANAIVWLQPG